MSSLIDKIKVKKKVIVSTFGLLTLPFTMTLFTLISKIIFEFGTIIGTYIRMFIEKGIC